MKTRIVLSVLIVVLLWIFNTSYDAAQGPIEGGAAVGQLADSDAQYAVSRAIAAGVIKKAANLIGVVLLIMIWLTALGGKSGNSAKILIISSVIGFTAIGCGPMQVEVNEEIQPHETAFLVPLEGATKSKQAQFMSEEYLNQNKVAAKRVTIPTRKRDTGRWWWEFEWISTVRLIRVDRKPVTRVWTKGKETGTSSSNQAFCVESRESVDFCAGATSTASIMETDAAKYLYNFAGKPLSTVMDEDIRGYAANILSREFGNKSLDQGRTDKARIFATAFKETSEFFKSKGVTLFSFGSSEGLQYTDAKIQDAINKTFIAENDKNTAENERVAQVKRNELNVAKATAERQAAEEFAKAKEAQIAIKDLEIRMVQAQAQLKLAENLKDLKGQLPSVVPQGSMFLFGMDRPVGQK